MQPTPREETETAAVLAELRQLRTSRGISQREIAEAMGIPQPNFNRLENGRYVPRMSTLQVWARALGYKVVFTLEKEAVSMDAIDAALAEIGVHPVDGVYEL